MKPGNQRARARLERVWCQLRQGAQNALKDESRADACGLSSGVDSGEAEVMSRHVLGALRVLGALSWVR